MTCLTTPGLAESIRNGWPTAALAAIDHPTEGIIRFWDGTGVLRWDGYDWKGLGHLGKMIGLGGSKRLLLRTVTFEISGLPEDAEVRLEPALRNRAAQAWIAGLDKRGRKVNGEPFQEVDGLVDYQELKAGDDGSQVIHVTIGEPVYSIERAQTLSYTPEWANSYLEAWRNANLSGDRITGYDRLSELANATRSWKPPT
jgi:hypothetical protein